MTMTDKDLLHPVAVQFPEPGGYCIPFRESALPVEIDPSLWINVTLLGCQDDSLR